MNWGTRKIPPSTGIKNYSLPLRLSRNKRQGSLGLLLVLLEVGMLKLGNTQCIVWPPSLPMYANCFISNVRNSRLANLRQANCWILCFNVIQPQTKFAARITWHFLWALSNLLWPYQKKGWVYPKQSTSRSLFQCKQSQIPAGSTGRHLPASPGQSAWCWLRGCYLPLPFCSAAFWWQLTSLGETSSPSSSFQYGAVQKPWYALPCEEDSAYRK